MSATAKRSVTIVYSGDVGGEQDLAAADNVTSPAKIDYLTLANGDNTITAPAGAVACTILPPPGNTTSIMLKGITGDTGVRIHNTDPTSIAIDSSVATFVLTAGASLPGVRLFWS